MAVRVVRFYIKSSNILIEIVVRDSIFSFLRSFNRFSLARLVAFSTSLVTLRGGLDHPSSASGTGTALPRRQSQQVHLGRCNHLDIGNLLSPWWRPGLHSLFQDLQRLLEKEFTKLPVEVLAGFSIAGC